MAVQWRTRLAAFAASLLTAALFAASGAAGARAASCDNWTGFPPPSPGDESGLSGVTAVSPCNVWAVGSSLNASAEQVLSLAEHWNGAAWKVVPTPSPDTNSNFLEAVDAVSTTDVWAVGFTGSNSLIVRWNGAVWKVVPSPDPGSDFNDLSGVDAVSATSAWAVGQFSVGAGSLPLLLRWNGKKWVRATIPTPTAGGELAAVTATTANNAWAVGVANTSIGQKTLILHWNGTKWARVASPNPQGKTAEVTLKGVAATSATNAWAVGDYATSSGDKTLILHWNGRAWKQVPSPNPGTVNELAGVAAVSTGNIWAVGDFSRGGPNQVLIAHCC